MPLNSAESGSQDVLSLCGRQYLNVPTFVNIFKEYKRATSQI